MMYLTPRSEKADVASASDLRPLWNATNDRQAFIAPDPVMESPSASGDACGTPDVGRGAWLPRDRLPLPDPGSCNLPPRRLASKPAPTPGQSPIFVDSARCISRPAMPLSLHVRASI